MNNVIILGGGVAGLTAAHELSERGYNVTIFEKEPICGGKARSMKHAGSGTGGWEDLPAEHGFRFFPGFYWHTADTMSRIWFDQPNNIRVLQNLVPGEKIGIAQKGKKIYRLEANPPTNLVEWFLALKQMFDNPSLGVPPSEAKVFLKKLLCFLGSGPTRRLKYHESISWWDYTEANSKSDAYKNLLVRGLSRSLVAMKPEKASTLTVASMLVQIVVNIIDPPGPGSDADRVLNAPTNDAWINPWVKQLQGGNPSVTIKNLHTAKELLFDVAKQKITGVKVSSPAGEQLFGDEFDHYIAAVPVEVVQNDQTLFAPALKKASGLTWNSSLGLPMGVDHLEVDWMTGVLFYLNRPATALRGHVIHATSPWALTSITQGQFWIGYPWAQRGDGRTRDILSAIISDWQQPAPPRQNKPARQCTKQELFTETWEQLKEHLALEPPPGKIADGDKVDEFLDPAITFQGGVVKDNLEPLLVNTVNSRQHRPAAKTAFANFYVAADYVKTNTDLACMEAANEAARHAVNALLSATGYSGSKCPTKKLKEPAIFEEFQKRDESRFTTNPGSTPELCLAFNVLDAEPGTDLESLAADIAASAGASGTGVPWWVWTLVALGVVNAVALLIQLLT